MILLSALKIASSIVVFLLLILILVALLLFVSTKLSPSGKIKIMINGEKEIEVDGGIGINNIKTIKESGANIFVAGSAIFNSDNYEDTIKKMKQEISAE